MIDQFIREKCEWAAKLCKQMGATQKHYRFGPVRPTIQFIRDDCLKEYTPALTHANIDQNGDFTIYVVNGAFIEPPPTKWIFPQDTLDKLRQAYWEPNKGYALTADDAQGIWSLYDRKAGRALYWVRDLLTLPDWEFGAPLRQILHWRAMDTGCQLAHGAVLEGGILITGKGGVGKSTTAMGAVLNGRRMVGEDFVLIQPGNPPIAHSIYCTVKLSEHSIRLLPEVAPLVAPGTKGEKRRLYLDKKNMLNSVPLEKLMVVKVGQKNRITPLSRAAALQALAPSTLFLMHTAQKQQLKVLAEIVRLLPCFLLEVNGDPKTCLEDACAGLV